MKKYPIAYEATKAGFCEWVPPLMRGYKMACCDCSLVHDMVFKVVKVVGRKRDGSWRYVNVVGEKYRVMFKARRNERSTAQKRRHKKK